MHPRRYLIVSLGLSAALTSGIAAVNTHFDPYGRDGTEAGERGGSPGAFWRKARAVRVGMPRTVILGTSRADNGLSSRDPAFSAQDAPVYNLALGGVGVEQMRLLLAHAHAISPVRKAVIGLDIESFLGSGRTDIDATGLEGNPQTEPYGLVRARLSLSRETLSASLAGRPPVIDDPIVFFNGQRGLSGVTEFNNFYWRLPLLFPHWTPASHWGDDPRRAASMTAFRALLDDARREGIELRMFISPVHARYLEWYRQVGWWPLFEAWKRALAAAIDDEARANPRRPAFLLWDFGGFHAPATEEMPRMGDVSTRMRWYFESSHYSPALGRLILARVLGAAGSGESPLPDLRIDAATIDRHLAALRSGADAYRLSHPGEVANINDMIGYLRRVARK